MISKVNKTLLEAVRPKSLREFWERVLYRPLPPLFERGKLYEEYGLGAAEEYLGSAVQNTALLEALKETAR